jgi:hypothetical protein
MPPWHEDVPKQVTWQLVPEHVMGAGLAPAQDRAPPQFT